MLTLGVNVDHIATVRQARGSRYPDPVEAALVAERAGADGITVHLREDRRHIQERDVRLLLEMAQTKVNLEMAASDEMVALACQLRPADCCLVPEKRAELTTEGGLDILANKDTVRRATEALSQAGIRVSLFIDPDPEQIRAAVAVGAPVVELHTGAYAESHDEGRRAEALSRIRHAVDLALARGLTVNAGHGLHYHNVQPIAAIPGLTELNIGHAIIARALFDGMERAVREMKRLMVEAAGWRT
ncbi:Pyridoxine 5'-phosphate synthase [Candidatus Magnetaquicoccaceae bacterium FCR-1]|uniref:Pyridoxine 5'-phosphate synthase n=1 Tax=Candidatus Magnetaquiglobus chichijimensis TaxID=3141448 RepID=A0ABQ0C6T5_9PROT